MRSNGIEFYYDSFSSDVFVLFRWCSVPTEPKRIWEKRVQIPQFRSTVYKQESRQPSYSVIQGTWR